MFTEMFQRILHEMFQDILQTSQLILSAFNFTCLRRFLQRKENFCGAVCAFGQPGHWDTGADCCLSRCPGLELGYNGT